MLVKINKNYHNQSSVVMDKMIIKDMKNNSKNHYARK